MVAFGEPWWLAAQLTDPGGLVGVTIFLLGGV